MMHKQRGYILFITFSMLALCTALVSVFMVKGITHKKLSSAMLEQEQLYQFTMSTVALGQSFLSFSVEEMKPSVDQKGGEDTGASSDAKALADKEKSEKTKPFDINKALLEKLVPVLGKTQEFKFQDIEKDFPVVINLIFFAESGKININGLYDLVLKKFYDEGVQGQDRKIFATWLFEKIAKITGKPSLLKPFEEYMKKRKSPLNDVTELLVIKEFSDCFADAVFYEKEVQNNMQNKQFKKLFLTDLFTVAHENDTIQPWLLSSSVCALLDIAQKSDKNDKVDMLKEKEEKIDVSSFKQHVDWQKDWDKGLKSLYNISYDKIPESVRGMLATSFQATVFSVLASVFNENMTVRVFAILKQKRLPDGAVVYDVIKTYQV